MRAAVVLGSIMALVAGACGGGVDSGSGEVPSTAASTVLRGEPIVIQTSLVIAATEGAEIPASGMVLECSTLGAAPFCVGDIIEDRHTAPDAAPPRLLDRTIT